VAEKRIVTWAAKRAMSDPSFLGFDLREYCQIAGVTEDDLSNALNCSTDGFNSLTLCLRPVPGSPTFRTDVERIATHCGAKPQRLMEVLREVDSIRSMRIGPVPRAPFSDGQAALLMAARDRLDRKRGHSRNRKPKG
jgi:hypothetical protein